MEQNTHAKQSFCTTILMQVASIYLIRNTEFADMNPILIVPSTALSPRLVDKRYLTDNKVIKLHKCCIQLRNNATSLCDI
jgi:hypothetical protein